MWPLAPLTGLWTAAWPGRRWPRCGRRRPVAGRVSARPGTHARQPAASAARALRSAWIPPGLLVLAGLSAAPGPDGRRVPLRAGAPAVCLAVGGPRWSCAATARGPRGRGRPRWPAPRPRSTAVVAMTGTGRTQGPGGAHASSSRRRSSSPWRRCCAPSCTRRARPAPGAAPDLHLTAAAATYLDPATLKVRRGVPVTATSRCSATRRRRRAHRGVGGVRERGDPSGSASTTTSGGPRSTGAPA